MKKRSHCVAVAFGALAVPAVSAPEQAPRNSTPLSPCVATATHAPVCGLHAPEDLDTLGDSSLLVVQMRSMTGKGESNLATIDVRTAAVRVLPERAAKDAPQWGDGSCKGPDPTPAFHGFDRWTGGDGRVRIVVVNHGTRSTIERYRLDGVPADASLAWEGCVAVPSDIELNDVAALPGDRTAQQELASLGVPEVT